MIKLNSFLTFAMYLILSSWTHFLPSMKDGQWRVCKYLVETCTSSLRLDPPCQKALERLPPIIPHLFSLSFTNYKLFILFKLFIVLHFYTFTAPPPLLSASSAYLWVRWPASPPDSLVLLHKLNLSILWSTWRSLLSLVNKYPQKKSWSWNQNLCLRDSNLYPELSSERILYSLHLSETTTLITEQQNKTFVLPRSAFVMRALGEKRSKDACLTQWRQVPTHSSSFTFFSWRNIMSVSCYSASPDASCLDQLARMQRMQLW